MADTLQRLRRMEWDQLIWACKNGTVKEVNHLSGGEGARAIVPTLMPQAMASRLANIENPRIKGELDDFFAEYAGGTVLHVLAGLYRGPWKMLYYNLWDDNVKNVKDAAGETPLWKAVRTLNLQYAFPKLIKLMDVSVLNYKNILGHTLLDLAAAMYAMSVENEEWGDVGTMSAVVKTLKSRGAKYCKPIQFLDCVLDPTEYGI